MAEEERHEQDLVEVGDWLNRIDEQGVVGTIDQVMLNRTLESLHGLMKIDGEEERSLKAYTNVTSRHGMNAVWGTERYDNFVSFCNDWISKYESVPGNIELPKLEKSGRKNAGMKEFFHELTAYAYGVLDKETFVLYTEARIKNGKLWQEGKKDERVKLETPISDGEKVRIASLPPGFIPAFWEWLKTSTPK